MKVGLSIVFLKKNLHFPVMYRKRLKKILIPKMMLKPTTKFSVKQRKKTPFAVCELWADSQAV